MPPETTPVRRQTGQSRPHTPVYEDTTATPASEVADEPSGTPTLQDEPQGPLIELPPDADTDEPTTTPGPPEDGIGALSVTELSDPLGTPTEDCDAETIPVVTEPDDEATDLGPPGIPERERRPYQSTPCPAPDDLRPDATASPHGPLGPGDTPGNLPQRYRRPPRYLDDYVREKAPRAPTNVPPPGHLTRDDPGPECRPYQLPDHPGHSTWDDPGPECRPYQLPDHSDEPTPGCSTWDDLGPVA
ncbi:cell surface glycoprotein 1-like [Bacillus rossius redtenbacheri]|uniref:cell surface glycoprotein 1-like n=1 Tax=Bacillus rossius redtenbacheri TaxID=93214 RepID=UPI002FDECF0B